MMLQATRNPCCRAVSVAVSVCLSVACVIDNVHATLQIFQNREPGRLPACLSAYVCVCLSVCIVCIVCLSMSMCGSRTAWVFSIVPCGRTPWMLRHQRRQ